MSNCPKNKKSSLIKPGDIAENIKINADCKWNDTGVILVSGENYLLKMDGYWYDSGIKSDATGYTTNDKQVPWYSWLALNLTSRLRRQPTSDWFSLIGCIGDSEDKCFDIGKKLKVSIDNSVVISAKETGTLYCYANDVSFAYGNNSGYIILSIKKLQNF